MTLTDRQQIIAQYVMRGLSDKEIARAMAITPGTVKGQVQAIFRKLHVSSRVDMTRRLLLHANGKDGV